MYKKYKMLVYTPPDLSNAKKSARFCFPIICFPEVVGKLPKGNTKKRISGFTRRKIIVMTIEAFLGERLKMDFGSGTTSYHSLCYRKEC